MPNPNYTNVNNDFFKEWSPELAYVVGFFIASFVDTTIIWTLSGITIALMTIPNLFGILILHKEVKTEVKDFWVEYKRRFPEENVPKG